MITQRSQLIKFIEQGVIPADKIRDALFATGVAPDGMRWRTFIDRLLIWIGGLALAFAVLFFIAYNWQDIGRFAKFGMVEGLIVLAIIAYCWLGGGSTAGKVSLLAAIICLGVLLAFYGQTYQTGADPWQLFFTWALMMLPWAIIGRFPVIWIVWVLLMNTSIVLYYQTFRGMFWFMAGSETGMLWLTFIFNTLILAVWEFLEKTWAWLSERWAIRLLAIGSGIPLTWMVIHGIFDSSAGSMLAAVVWVCWLALMYYVYRKLKPDLFMLAACCLSIITVVVSFFGKYLLVEAAAGSFLILALLVIGMGAGAAFWLKNVHREFQT